MSAVEFKSNENPLVSVIIPLYNAEKYIAETIQNVLNQTYQPIEVIIVDDGSKDRSLSVAKSFESEKVKVFSQTNKGASAARNYGLREAKGEFIQFLDADDLLSANKIEEQVKLLMSSNENTIAVCSTAHFFQKEEINQEEISIDDWFEKIGNPVEFIIKLYGGYTGIGRMIAVHAWLSPKSIIKRVGYWNESLTVDDDGEFFCRVVLESDCVAYTPFVSGYYRKYESNSNLSGQSSYAAMKSALNACFEKKKYLLSKTDDINAKKAIARIFHEFAVLAYPKYKDLSKVAETESQSLYPHKNTSYYHTFFYRIITPLFGWKTSARIAFLKKSIRTEYKISSRINAK